LLWETYEKYIQYIYTVHKYSTYLQYIYIAQRIGQTQQFFIT